MIRISAPLRIAFCLALVGSCVYFTAKTVGLFPDSRLTELRGRLALSEAAAANCSLLASNDDFEGIGQTIEFLRERNPEILSIGLRKADGELVVETGSHAQAWAEGREAENDGCILVPITSGPEAWGQLEMRFRPLYPWAWQRYVDPTFLLFSSFCVVGTGLLFAFLLRRVLRALNPSRVVPPRVRAALDTMAEGIVLLDKDERIVLANRAFAQNAGVESDELVGRRVEELSWQSPQEDQPLRLPWQETTQKQEVQKGGSLALQTAPGSRRVFVVNSTPIRDEGGAYRGALASFDDVTDLEEHRHELMRLLDVLKQSRDEIHQQNEELRFLATRDSLTGCLNRRTFFELFEQHWKQALRYGHSLSCVIVDIDFFKAINDNHGHSMGDEVLRRVGACLNEQARDTDVVCRYGGEEFCVLFPHLDLDGATQAAERLRLALAALKFNELSITASIGVSSNAFHATAPQELLDQADKCLYVAKRNGRNQVVRFDQTPEDLVVDESKISRTKTEEPAEESTIPYSAVRALLSALSYRDTETAAHSSRVAELAALLARKVVGASEAYVIEVAALLHDIGKIGVPDSILLKPGRLSSEEWRVMEMHDRFGVEIISSSFNCEPLTAIIRNHHALYGGDPSKPNLPQAEDIPIGARIISIADAYDAMVSDRVYRKGRSVDDACRELRRCAGRQFDPELVELFIELVDAYHGNERKQVGMLSRDTMLNIGLQVESLVQALDGQDFEGMHALLGRLHSTAERFNIPHVAQHAKQLAELVAQEPDLRELVTGTHELLEMCQQLHTTMLGQVREGPVEEAVGAGAR